MIWWPLEVPTLHSGLITLRPLQDSDIDPIYEACQDLEIPRFTRVVKPYTRELAIEFVRTSPFAFLERKALQFAITYSGAIGSTNDTVRGGGTHENSGTSSNYFAGAISLHTINLSDHCAELGYWMSAELRGKGICSAAAKLLTEYALETIGFERIEALVDTENIASEKVLLSAGFMHEGRLVKKATRQDGTQKDMDIFAATRT
jgi:RimJ/RimL family protein N-acetyltransferase